MGLLSLGVLLAAAITLAGGTAVARRSPPSRETAVAAARAHATHASGAALLLGSMAALYVGTTRLGDSSPGGLGVTALLVPIAFGVVHTAVLALGELTWPRPQGEVRRARLVRRGLVDQAAPWLVRVGGLAAGLVVVVLLGGGLLAEEDGRSVSAGSDLVRATASPFPGVFYGAPAGIGLLVLGALTAAALWIVADRPAVATADDAVEAALRRASVHRVLRVAVAVPLVVAGGLLFVAGRAWHSVATSSVDSGLLGAVGTATSVIGGAALVAGVVVACIRAPGVPADAPPVRAG
ncbi:hypothetical protein [Blastococcus litoris]|uniref:hypothetical protein n=1 Tax=Blastococcus litoris TaxID=2171622 RepID=UPI0013DE8A17|nr:hypothetical protein [Blastococcus litoris]